MPGPSAAHLAAQARAPHALDHLGRVVVPVALRRRLGWGPGTALMMRIDGARLIVERFRGLCVFCGSDDDDGGTLLGQTVCPACRAALRRTVTARGAAAPAHQ